MAVVQNESAMEAEKALKDEKPLQPTDKISSYILIKNAESNPEVLASIQQLTKKISDDSKLLSQTLQQIQKAFYALVMLILPVLFGMTVDIIVEQLITCPKILKMIRICIGVSYALTWAVALPMFFRQWYKLKTLMTQLTQLAGRPASTGDKGQEVETVGASSGSEESGSESGSDSDDENAKGDAQDNNAADEEIMAELALDKEICASGDQEDQTPLLMTD